MLNATVNGPCRQFFYVLCPTAGQRASLFSYTGHAPANKLVLKNKLFYAAFNHLSFVVVDQTTDKRVHTNKTS